MQDKTMEEVTERPFTCYRLLISTSDYRHPLLQRSVAYVVCKSLSSESSLPLLCDVHNQDAAFIKRFTAYTAT